MLPNVYSTNVWQGLQHPFWSRRLRKVRTYGRSSWSVYLAISLATRLAGARVCTSRRRGTTRRRQKLACHVSIRVDSGCRPQPLSAASRRGQGSAQDEPRHTPREQTPNQPVPKQCRGGRVERRCVWRLHGCADADTLPCAVQLVEPSCAARVGGRAPASKGMRRSR